MPDSIDIENLVVAMALELRRNNGNWMTFRELARRIRGDVEDAHLLAAIAATRKELFVIHADTRLKLRFEAIQEIATQSTGPNTVSPPMLHTEAGSAVTEYARQLRPLQFHVISTDKGRRVLDRYVHGLGVDIADDDVKLADDTPVELISLSAVEFRGRALKEVNRVANLKESLKQKRKERSREETPPN